MINYIVILLIIFGILVFTLAIFVDLLSLYLNLQRVKRGYGPSGIPGLSTLVYLGFLTQRYTLIFVTLVTFHILCHFIIPIVYGKWSRRKRRGV